MLPGQLVGKAVLGTGARVVGHVSDIEFTIPSWQVTHICLELADDSIEPLGFRKPRIRGSVKVDIPVGVVQAVSDVVALNKSLEELRTVVRRR